MIHLWCASITLNPTPYPMLRTCCSHTTAVVALALFMAACNNTPPPAEAPPPPDMAALTSQVQAMEDAYATASIARDVDGVMAYYAEDVVSYMSERGVVQGKAAVRARMEERMAKDTTGTKPSFKVLDLFVGNEHLTEIGEWTDTDAQGNVTDHGTYISVFRKKGDGWECIREMAVSAKEKEKAAEATAAAN